MKTILDFPNFRQSFKYDCGAVAVEAVLAYYGIDVPAGKIIEMAGTTKRNGTPIKGIIKVIKKFGLKCSSGPISIDLLKKNISAGIPVIIPLQAWARGVTEWKKSWSHGHYVVAIGFDSKRVFFMDPFCFAKTYLSFSELEERWHDTAAKKKFIHWGISVWGKKPNYSLHRTVHMDYSSFNPKKAAYSKYLLLK